MNKYIENICNLIDAECSACGMSEARCLASSVILSEVLRAEGFSSTLFTCEFNGFSKILLDLIRSGAAKNMSGNELVAASARCVSVLANRLDSPAFDFNGNKLPSALYGHAALLLHHNESGQCWFVDPTAFQFSRSKDVNGWVLNAPRYFVLEVKKDVFYYISELNTLKPRDIQDHPMLVAPLGCGGELHYDYRRLDSLESEEMVEGGKAWLRSDANPKKFATVVSRVKEQLAFC